MNLKLSLSLATCVVASLLTVREARAGLDSCGHINVSADARCKLETKGGCTAQCEPIHVQATCSARLYADCNGTCNVAVEASCNTSCKADCTGQCTVNPPQFDCEGSCTGRCEGNCEASCSSSSDKTHCVASCKGTCGGECNVQCKGTPPSADCSGKCEASCSGSCTAKANLDCQVKCQAGGYAKCEADVEGGCKVQCEKPEGALFCDGQFVDAGNNLEDCIASLNSYLKIKVDASGSASCEGNECTAEGKASVSCAMAPGDSSGPFHAEALALGALGITLARRRKRS